MKLALLWAIIKNLAKLGTYDFWNKVCCDPDYPGWLFAKIIIVEAVVDIFLIIFVPGYPEQNIERSD